MVQSDTAELHNTNSQQKKLSSQRVCTTKKERIRHYERFTV